jgi:ferritin-like metal-binding protein YciE
MNQETLKELFIKEIRDLYDAEKQIVKTLPKIAKAAEAEELTEALNTHLEETRNHVSRLEQVFEIMGETAKGKPCKGMKGLLEEGGEVLQEEDKGALRDLALIAGCQKVEHYEVSAYGTVRTLAERLDMQDVVQLLQETENEEAAADEKLTEVAAAILGREDMDESAGEEAEPVEAGSSRRPASGTHSKRKAS